MLWTKSYTYTLPHSGTYWVTHTHIHTGWGNAVPLWSGPWLSSADTGAPRVSSCLPGPHEQASGKTWGNGMGRGKGARPWAGGCGHRQRAQWNVPQECSLPAPRAQLFLPSTAVSEDSASKEFLKIKLYFSKDLESFLFKRIPQGIRLGVKRPIVMQMASS